MKLCRFNGARIGVVIDGTVRDVTAAAQIDPEEWPPVGPVRLIAAFQDYRTALQKAAEAAPGLAVETVTFDAPIPWPNKLLAWPVNYHDHAVEMNSKGFANIQGFFLKANSSLIGGAGPIELPDLPAREVHHECELAVVIGRRGRQIPPEAALDHVFGYSCLLDITVRGKEERVMRKSFDTFTPMGPWIVTSDEVTDPAAIDMKLWVNDELRQSASTRQLIVDIPSMISIASAAVTLEPGDIIATGTPAGVGRIVAGDTVKIEISGVGEMTVPVVAGRFGMNPVFSKPYEFVRNADNASSVHGEVE